MMRSHGRIFFNLIYCASFFMFIHSSILIRHHIFFISRPYSRSILPPLSSFHHSSAYVHVPTQRTYSAFLRDTLNLLPLLCIWIDLFHILTHNTIVIWSNILCMVVKAGVRYIGVLKWPKQEIANMID